VLDSSDCCLVPAPTEALRAAFAAHLSTESAAEMEHLQWIRFVVRLGGPQGRWAAMARACAWEAAARSPRPS